jgi:formylglycine-generating enzyme required for sulfatase activity
VRLHWQHRRIKKRLPTQAWCGYPAANFSWGPTNTTQKKRRPHRVAVDGFWMDRCVVTNEQFRRFTEATKHVTSADRPPNPDDYPGAKPDLLAFGNSDGDLQMLQYTAAGSGARFMMIVHHTDAEREWAYDRKSHIGRLDKALDEANAKGWTVDMKRDWRRVFPFEK